MNLKFINQNAPSGAHNTIGGAAPMSDEVVVARVTAAKAAAEAQLADLVTALEARCAQAERDRWRNLGNDAHGGAVTVLANQISDLEGEIAYLEKALAGLS